MKTNRHIEPRRLFGLVASLRRFAPFCWVLLCVALAPGARAEPPTAVRFGFSRAMFRELNEGDTRAAVRNYASVIAADHSLKVVDTLSVFSDTKSIANAFADTAVDIISMATEEFLALPRTDMRPGLLVARQGGQTTENYLLLVRTDSDISDIAALKGRKLVVLDNLRSSLGSVWLEVMLGERGLAPPHLFFSLVSPVPKVSRTVLPVFFGQADVCLVTRRGYETLGELNPQVLKQLRILESSPDYVPHVTALRATLPDEIAGRVFKAITAAQHTVPGRQVLAIFQCDQIVELTETELENARDLLAARDRLRAARQLATDAAPAPAHNP